MLSHGANPQSPNHQGFTPLHWAAKNAHIESLQILLKHGAQSIPNDNNDRPIDLAAELQLTKVVSLLLEATPNDIHYSLHLETCYISNSEQQGQIMIPLYRYSPWRSSV
uniref:Uncharacterized protein n=1 Tax=Arcella intermedia TaxID=1963864 RepID=A0A6B2LSI1_9EUKA